MAPRRDLGQLGFLTPPQVPNPFGTFHVSMFVRVHVEPWHPTAGIVGSQSAAVVAPASAVQLGLHCDEILFATPSDVMQHTVLGGQFAAREHLSALAGSIPALGGGGHAPLEQLK